MNGPEGSYSYPVKFYDYHAISYTRCIYESSSTDGFTQMMSVKKSHVFFIWCMNLYYLKVCALSI